MRQLPIDLSAIIVDLPRGRYSAPSYWNDEDFELLSLALLGAVEELKTVVEIPASALAHRLKTSRPTSDNTLVVIHACDSTAQLSEETPPLGGIVLVQQRWPNALDLRWVEQDLKRSLMEQLSDQLTQHHHPLAPWNIAAFPIDLAAELSADAVDLLALVSATIAHRLGNAALGIDTEAYHRSLLVSAGRRLVARLSSVAASEVGPALEVLLSRTSDLDEGQRSQEGLDGLLELGLARGEGGDVRLQPLVSRIEHPLVWGELARGMAHEAWTPLAREKLRRLRRRRPSHPEATPPVAGSTAEVRAVDFDLLELRGRVVLASTDLEVGCTAVDLLTDLCLLPAYTTTTPPELEHKLEIVMPRLKRAETDGLPETKVAWLLGVALRFWSSLGPEERGGQTDALVELEAALAEDPESALLRSIVGSARVVMAQRILAAPASEEELVEAERLALLEREDSQPGSARRALTESVIGHSYLLRGRTVEAEQWFLRALTSSEQLGDRNEIAEVCHRLGATARDGGELDRALEFFQRSLDLKRERDDQGGMAEIYHDLGNVAFLKDDYVRSLEWHTKAAALFSSLGHPSGVSLSQRSMGMAYEKLERPGWARRCYEKALEIDRDLGHRANLAASLHHLGNLAYVQGTLDEASSWYRQALESFEELGNSTGKASTYHQMGLVAQSRGSLDEAHHLYEEALEIFSSEDNQLGGAAVQHQLGMVERERSNDDAALSHFLRSLEVKRALHDAPGAASSLSQIGVLHTECGRPEEGLRWSLRALQHREQRALGGQRLDLHWIQRQRERLGRERFQLLLEQYLEDPAEIDRLSRRLDGRLEEATSRQA